jgi:hypothetical protein
MRWKNRPDKDKVKVIRDIRNSSRDYWLQRERAEQLYKEGKLIQIQAYDDRWVYATKTPEEYYF